MKKCRQKTRDRSRRKTHRVLAELVRPDPQRPAKIEPYPRTLAFPEKTLHVGAPPVYIELCSQIDTGPAARLPEIHELVVRTLSEATAVPRRLLEPRSLLE